MLLMVFKKTFHKSLWLTWEGSTKLKLQVSKNSTYFRKTTSHSRLQSTVIFVTLEYETSSPQKFSLSRVYNWNKRLSSISPKRIITLTPLFKLETFQKTQHLMVASETELQFIKSHLTIGNPFTLNWHRLRSREVQFKFALVIEMRI